MILWGCATSPEGQEILAIVDGEPITIKDLEYSLQVSHRREDLSSTGEMNIPKFVLKLIDDKLIAQEARRMGMEDYPEVQKRVNAFILRGAVTKLYNDEIKQKVSVSEEEVRERFMHDHELFTLDIITVATREDAADILARIDKGEDFKELAREYSVDYPKNGGEKVFKRKNIGAGFVDVVPDLKAGETSDIISIRSSFSIVRLVKREKAAEEEYENFREGIEKEIRKYKEDRRSGEYLAELRSKANVDINRELLDSIKIDGQHGLEKWLKDNRILVKLNNRSIRAGEFAAKLSPKQIDNKERVLNSWIDHMLVDDEALSRKYETKPDLGSRLERYKALVLKNIFIQKMIMPGIMVYDEELEEYYSEHIEEFAKPIRYRIQQITVKDIKDARSVMRSLEGGASFSWLAKKKSKDSVASKGGAVGWKTKRELSTAETGIIDTLEPGDFSTILEMDDHFKIIRLIEKSEKEFNDLDKVKNIIHKKIFSEKFDKVYNEYIDRLKKTGVQIEVFDERVEAFQGTFRK
jgi:parvulin-like peptidyl-prolyl isomerase